jgi:hypothetical protein
MYKTNESTAERVQYVHRSPQQYVSWYSDYLYGWIKKTIVVELSEEARGVTLLQNVRNGQLLIQREWETLLRGYNYTVEKLTTYLNTLPRLRMHGATHQLPHPHTYLHNMVYN